jgi:hypothetical protein
VVRSISAGTGTGKSDFAEDVEPAALWRAWLVAESFCECFSRAAGDLFVSVAATVTSPGREVWCGNGPVAGETSSGTPEGAGWSLRGPGGLAWLSFGSARAAPFRPARSANGRNRCCAWPEWICSGLPEEVFALSSKEGAGRLAWVLSCSPAEGRWASSLSWRASEWRGIGLGTGVLSVTPAVARIGGAWGALADAGVGRVFEPGDGRGSVVDFGDSGAVVEVASGPGDAFTVVAWTGEWEGRTGSGEGSSR